MKLVIKKIMKIFITTHVLIILITIFITGLFMILGCHYEKIVSIGMIIMFVVLPIYCLIGPIFFSKNNGSQEKLKGG